MTLAETSGSRKLDNRKTVPTGIPKNGNAIIRPFYLTRKLSFDKLEREYLTYLAAVFTRGPSCHTIGLYSLKIQRYSKIKIYLNSHAM
jgi:hypothetical protein